MQLARGFYKTIARLESMPEAHALDDDKELARKGIRKCYYRRYKIYFYIDESAKKVYVLRVLHMLVDAKPKLILERTYQHKKAHLPLGALFCASIAALLPHEEVSRICNIQKHARSPLTAGHASAGTGEYEEQNGTAKEQYGVDDGLSEDMQRADHRGHSEDKQDVEQVGADGIAQRQPAVSLFRGNDGGHQLRQGGADGDNGQSDEILADTKIRSYDAGFIYHQIPTEDNGSQTSGNIQKAAGQGEDLAGFALFSVFPGRIDHKSEIYDHAQQQDSAFNAA